MTVEVALAMLEHRSRFLLQLRDDVPGIVAPGLWGLCGGHLDPGEAPEQALRRELREEIDWIAGDLSFWFCHANDQRIVHFFRASLPLPLSALRLLEGQDMGLASLDDLRRGRLWSDKLGEFRALAPSLQCAVARLAQGDLPPRDSPLRTAS